MQLSAEERTAVENGQPVRCAIPGSSVRCVVIRDDVFDALQLPVSVVEDDMLNDIYLGLSHDSPDEWKHSSEWKAEAKLDLIEKLRRFIQYFNETIAKPMNWTYTGRPTRNTRTQRPRTWRELRTTEKI